MRDASLKAIGQIQMYIVLAEQQELVRDTLIVYLKSLDENVQVVPASSVSEAIELVAGPPKRDLLLLDLLLPDMNGLDGLDRARDGTGGTPIVLFAPDLNGDLPLQALCRGAFGVVTKSMRGTVILSALRLMLSGERYVPTPFLDYLLSQYAQRTVMGGAPARATDSRLTEREVEVLRLLGSGMSNREIAKALRIADATARVHLRQVFRKLGARNRVDAVRIGLSLGLLAPAS